MTAESPSRTTGIAAVIDRIRAAIRGRVVTPDDPEYDRDRAIVYGGVDPRREGTIMTSAR